MLNFSGILAAGSPLDHAVAHPLHSEPLFTVKVGEAGYNNKLFGIHDGQYDFYITNHMMMTLITALAVMGVFLLVAWRVKPRGEGIARYETRGTLGQLFEAMCVFVRNDIAKSSLGKIADKYIYYIWTIFFFILFSNLLGLIPSGYLLRLAFNDTHMEHWGGTATSNLALNLVLAVGSLVMILGVGIREQGLLHFLGHFNPMGWALKDLWIGIPLFFLEWMGLMIKCTVLAMRLFGTMMAGHLAIAAVIGIIFFFTTEYGAALGYGSSPFIVIGSVLLMMLELLICCLQAFIFTFLTVLFISLGAVGGHDHDEHDAHVSAA